MSEDNKKDGFLSDTDDFWSLDSMLPPTEKRCFSPSVKNDVTTVFEHIWTGGMPQVQGVDEELRGEYFNSYIH